MKLFMGLVLALVLVLPARADQTLVMARSNAKASHVMDVLKETLPEYGYSIAHTQRCDGGMAEFHYKTDFYRVVFFGKLDEVRGILARYPEMSPYLPLKIAVIAENDETVLAAMDPRALGAMFPDDQVLHLQFDRWYNDIRAMLEEMRQLKK
jgi:uncharacterized protein (DUF302 family)